MNANDCNAKIVYRIKCGRDCADDCGAKERGWFVQEDQERGKFMVIASHDTDCFDGDGEHCGYGANFEVAADADFDTREEAEAFMKAFCV